MRSRVALLQGPEKKKNLSTLYSLEESTCVRWFPVLTIGKPSPLFLFVPLSVLRGNSLDTGHYTYRPHGTPHYHRDHHDEEGQGWTTLKNSVQWYCTVDEVRDFIWLMVSTISFRNLGKTVFYGVCYNGLLYYWTPSLQSVHLWISFILSFSFGTRVLFPFWGLSILVSCDFPVTFSSSSLPVIGTFHYQK